MAPSRESSTERRHDNTHDIAATVRLPDYYVDATQAWFRQINSIFAASCVTRLLTKYHWAISKLPSTLVDVIGSLRDDPTAVADPYAELQAILLRSYGLSTTQRTVRYHQRPSILMDQLITLRPDSMDNIQKVLFFQKMLTYIRDAINPKNCATLADLMQCCNEVWEHHNINGGATTAAVTKPRLSHSPACGNRRSSSPSQGKRQTYTRPNNSRPTNCRLPTPFPARSSWDCSNWCIYHTHFGAATCKCDIGCTYQENK
jgi:hypothetical protein